jgi:Transcriptional regulator PadR-like family
MGKSQERAALLQGTLDMLILGTLLYGPAHGHQIGKHIQRTTNDFLQMQHGSLYRLLYNTVVLAPRVRHTVSSNRPPLAI